jgi:alginate O-acetyltransferase complex protein AlgI
MLFNTLPFLFLFLPVVLIGFYVLGRFSKLAAAAFLALQI